LLLRELTIDDVPEMAAHIFADPQVMHFSPKRNLTPIARAERTLQLYAERWEQYPVGGVGLAITAKVDGRFMGFCDLGPVAQTQPETEPNTWELAYYLGNAYWGQGFMTEAVRALLHFAFDTMAVGRVVAAIFPENIASRRVLEHLRFVYVRDVNYAELTGETTMEMDALMLPYFELRREQFVPGDAFYRVRENMPPET
jgi:ribosomal-protein-alanine N-acetyltransferase